MKKILIYFLTALIIISCSKNDNEEEVFKTDLKLNIVEGILSSNGDSIDIVSASGQNLYACLDTVGISIPIAMEYTSEVFVSDKVRYQISDIGWYSITRVYSTETQKASKLILKVKPNDTHKERIVPLTIFSNCYDNYATGKRGGIYIKTNFVQSPKEEK